MYGRKMQRKIAHRRPITFRGYTVNRKPDVYPREGGETEIDLVARLRHDHGKSVRLTPRY